MGGRVQVKLVVPDEVQRRVASERCRDVASQSFHGVQMQQKQEKLQENVYEPFRFIAVC